jgi:hypothetical protein
MTQSHACARHALAKRNGKSPRPTAAPVGGLFFPQGKSLGIDRSEFSPGLFRKIVYAGTNNTSFKKAHEDVVELLDLNVSIKQIERMTERIGSERCAERDAAVEEYLSLPLAERKDKPAGVVAPALAVVGVDGGRLQIREAKSASAEALPTDEKHRGTHWREDKIATLMPMISAVHASDPCPEVPSAFIDPTRIVKLTRELKAKKSARVESACQESAQEADDPEEADAVLRDAGVQVKWQPPQVKEKYLTATRQPWSEFGPMVALLAWTLGFFQAPRKAFLGDGSENNWAIWRNHFSSFTPILDIIHVISYVFAAALAGRPFAEGWECYVRWLNWVWQGEVEKVIAELAQRQVELGSPLAEDGETHPRQVVSTALGYLQTHKDKMRYAEYRKQGLPITSCYVESAVKQFNQRVKGSEKFWTEEGAEALLQLRADYLSAGQPMNNFWQTRQDNETGQRQYTMAA